ncbi:glycosyltransferase family 2 protein [Candidatus Bathyarchaeota archaeon]|nr:MAG: glycosyltransferase [Candidatus Bathyarchaeota archaeon]RLG39916.1 MAG: glycosyltransferase family 2 protein [Candidatus Korarchaeota archaeon]RLI10923.1 MAG: glycosyltransferase family 2 protein [Candidatus Bathyarchaeota archaeon]
MTVYILLPCYNEERNIKELIYRISEVCRNLDYKIVAVDDGSKDKTYPYLCALTRNYPIVILRHEENKGLHEALRTLLIYIYNVAGHSDYLITMDSDLTHDPKYIPQLISACEEEEADIAIASRFVDGGKQIGVPLHRAFLSWGLRFFVKFMLGIPVRDVSSGYRCIRVSSIKRIMEKYGFERFVEARGFEVQLELLYKLFLNGAKIVEVPFILDYSLKKGESKLKIRRTIFGYLRTILKLRNLRNSIFSF